MLFDGYRVPQLSSKSKDGASTNFTWYAVLVWCGRKPSPKYCSTKEDLVSSPYFHEQMIPGTAVPNGCVSYDELVAKSPKGMLDVGKGAAVKVGEVSLIKIMKYFILKIIVSSVVSIRHFSNLKFIKCLKVLLKILSLAVSL